MISIFIDSDVAFDVISKRKPFYEDSARILQLVKDGKIVASTSESCLGNLIHLSFEIKKLKYAKEQIIDYIQTCSVLTCGKKGILEALNSDFKDKEDAIQYHTALYNDMDYFVTRNIKDYKAAVKSLPVITPKELSELLTIS